MKNPRWHRDELILTLDFYFDENSGSFTSANLKVIELSKLLNILPLYREETKNEKFRNANSVAMKLGNFRALDPKSNLTGLQSYSKLDKMIFDEFSNNRVDLKRISKSIMETVENESFLKQLNHIEKSLDEIDAYEGEVLFKVHKFRERDIKIVELKKADHFKKFGKLECQVCDFDFYVTYGELGLNFIECHHLNHLSSYIKNQKTKLDDLALVCSNCHKMLHRLSTNMSLESLKEKLQKS